MAPTHPIPLLAHPWTTSECVRSLLVDLWIPTAGQLALRYTLRGDMSRIRIAPEVDPGPGRELWKHTCFEAFIQPGSSQGYYEFNFSPTRQWAVYRFSGYREGMTSMVMANPPGIRVTRAADHLELEATFPLPVPADAAAPPRLALTAVVEEENGRLCYWSGRHAPGKPDFHHPDGFAFEL
jgi:hypothetical protein